MQHNVPSKQEKLSRSSLQHCYLRSYYNENSRYIMERPIIVTISFKGAGGTLGSNYGK